MSKVWDVIQIVGGIAQVAVGGAIVMIDGPAPVLDAVGFAVGWRGRQNIKEGSQSFISPQYNDTFVAENSYWLSQGVVFYP